MTKSKKEKRIFKELSKIPAKKLGEACLIGMKIEALALIEKIDEILEKSK